MNSAAMEPHRPDPALQLAGDDAFWGDAARRDSEVWRYARRLAAAGGVPLETAQAPGEDARARTRWPPANAGPRLRGVARGVGQALLLVAAAGAGVANGMAVGGGNLIDLQPWRPLVAQTAPTPDADGSALIPGAALVAPAPTITIPALSLGAALEPAPEPAESLVSAAATGGVVAGATVRPALPVPPAPTALGRPAGAWRVQLALLRNPRHAETVWQSFVARLGAPARGLERHVLPTRTARGLRHLVQVGPFADAGAAAALCQRLRAAGGDCLVVPPPS